MFFFCMEPGSSYYYCTITKQNFHTFYSSKVTKILNLKFYQPGFCVLKDLSTSGTVFLSGIWHDGDWLKKKNKKKQRYYLESKKNHTEATFQLSDRLFQNIFSNLCMSSLAVDPQF